MALCFVFVFYQDLTRARNMFENYTLCTTRQEVASCPPGCKISPRSSKVHIEQNFASTKSKAVVESIHILPERFQKWPDNLALL